MGGPVESASVQTSLPDPQHLVRSPKWHRFVHRITLEAHCMRRTWDPRYSHYSPIDLLNPNPLNGKEPITITSHPSRCSLASIVTHLSPFLAVRALYPFLWGAFLPPLRLACETWRKSLTIPSVISTTLCVHLIRSYSEWALFPNCITECVKGDGVSIAVRECVVQSTASTKAGLAACSTIVWRKRLIERLQCEQIRTVYGTCHLKAVTQTADAFSGDMDPKATDLEILSRCYSKRQRARIPHSMCNKKGEHQFVRRAKTNSVFGIFSGGTILCT